MRTLRRRALKPVAIALAASVVLAMVLDAVTPAASGPTSSSYATAPDGLGAYAQLLAQSGHPVNRLRVTPARARLDPRQTLILLDPANLLAADLTAIKRFLSAGGHVVAGGQNPRAWLTALLADPPVWRATGDRSSAPLVPTAETSGVSNVVSAGEGSWSEPRATLPVLGSTGSTLLSVAGVGAGRIALLADASPLQNRLLQAGDDAALGVALAGPAGRPVAFEEAVHGYGQASGLAGLPIRWKWVLSGLVLAALTAVASRIRRLAPSEPAGAPALPPRRDHIDALALALARTGRPGEATATVRERARQQVVRRAGLDADARAGEFAQAAARLGLDAEETQALFVTAPGEAEMMSAGRALAKLSGPRG